MTYDEAVNVIYNTQFAPDVVEKMSPEYAARILDAISFTEMEERIVWLEEMMVKFGRERETALKCIEELEHREKFRQREWATEKEWSDVFEERDAARALADQLADDADSQWRYENEPTMLSWDDVVAKHKAALAAYEARGWK